MPRPDADTQLAIDTVVDMGLLDPAGLGRFAELVKSLQGLTSPLAAVRRPGRPESNGADEAEAAPSPAERGRKRRRGKLTITKDELRAAYATKSQVQIAAEHGVTPGAVQQRLAKWKIKKPAGGSAGAEKVDPSLVAETKAKSGGKRGKTAWRAATKDELAKAYAAKSASEIAKEYGVSAKAVGQRLARLGIKKPGAGRKKAKGKA